MSQGRAPFIPPHSFVSIFCLPVTTGIGDWARFFAGMVHLQRLEIGGVTLIRHVLEAFERAADTPSWAAKGAGRGLCAELEEVSLCFGGATNLESVNIAGEESLSECVPRTIGVWVRRRARLLRTLTVLMQDGLGAEGSSGVQPNPSVDSSPEHLVKDHDGPSNGGGPKCIGEESPGARLWRGLVATLKPGGPVEEVVLMKKGCGACDEVYETVDEDEFSDGELEESVTHY